MAEVGISEYCDEVKLLVRGESYDEAKAICRYILERYPRYIPAYRLLGETTLEKGEYAEAADLFMRVLSADPEDVVAHVGMAVVCDERKQTKEALWHLERAFELAPGNAEIREELRRLYRERDAAPTARLKLTPAGLARLYLKEGLYDRAISEIRPLLQADPSRVDLAIALAEALWKEGRRREAAETCQEALETIPNCLKACLILGTILKESGQEEEGEALLSRAQALDPENKMAQALLGEASPLKEQRVLIPRMEAAPAVEEAPQPSEEPQKPTEETPEWLRRLEEITAAAEQETPPVAEEEAPPAAQEAPPAVAEAPPVAEHEAEVPEPSTTPEEVSEVPDWLKGLAERTEEPSPEAEPEEVPTSEEIPDWLRALEQPKEKTTGVTPVAPAEVPPTQKEAAEETPSKEVESTPPAPEEAPDWLQTLRAEAVTPPEAPLTPAEEIPVEAEIKPEAPPEEAQPLTEEAAPTGEQMVAATPEQVEVAQPLVENYLDRLASQPDDHQTRLALARAYLEQGKPDEALGQYRQLIDVAEVIPEVIGDLEKVTSEAPEYLPAHQLLGDAYMKGGRVTEALDKYRWLRGKLAQED